MKIGVYIVFFLLLLSSCGAGKEIVEVIKTEYIVNTVVDSIYEKDSVDKYTRGDTVFIYKEHTKYKYLNKIDTVIKVDSIPKIVNKIKEVKINYLKWYQEALMWIGGISLLLLACFIIYKIKLK